MTVTQRPIPFVNLRTLPDPEPTLWLWEHYFSYGHMTLVDGEGGVGKGLLAVQACLRVLKKGDTVMWFTMEEDPEEIKRRFLAAGWDPNKDGQLWVFDEDREDEGGGQFLAFPRDRKRFAEAIETLKPEMIVLDPGRTFLSPEHANQTLSFNDDAVVRAGLRYLRRTAKTTNVVMIFIHHHNRDSKAPPSQRFTGSQAFIAVPRHRVTLSRVGTRNDSPSAIGVTKSNIHSRGHVIAYVLDECPEYDTAVWRSLGPVDHDEEDLDDWWRSETKNPNGIQVSRTDEVLDWLDSHFQPGERLPSRDVLRKTLKKDLGMEQKWVEEALEQAKTEEWTRYAGRSGLMWNGRA